MAMEATTFFLFPTLPPELRNLIWREALPDQIEPALYFYKKGCWISRHLTHSDENYDPTDDDNNLNLEFRHDLLDAVQLEMPLLSVSREARSIALGWAREQCSLVETRELSGDGEHPVFVCPFDPSRDVLYVALGKWPEFLAEPVDKYRELNNKLRWTFNVKPADVTHIAIPAAVLRRARTAILAMCLVEQYFSRLEELLIVVGKQPDLSFVDDDKTVQRRWELEGMPEEILASDTDCSDDDYTNSKEALYRLLGEAKEALRSDFVRNYFPSTKIRPVIAVRR